MKKLLLISLFLFLSLQLFAQAPQQFSFQGVARDAAGKVIANTTVSLRLTIHESLPLGPNLYQETHKPLTSSGGIFTVSVGVGLPENGVFKDINWSSGSFFLQVELDATGGTNYIDLGATQLLSVPYALHAGQADKWKDGDPVVQNGIEGQGDLLLLPPIAGGTTRLIWYPRKAAFRAGRIYNDNWSDINIGSYSAAFGVNTLASGDVSFAVGFNTSAIGLQSVAFGSSTSATHTNSFASGDLTKATRANAVAMGWGTEAKGHSSMAIGKSSQATGNFSFSAGLFTVAQSNGSASFGLYNDDQDFAFSGPSARIFQIGNGDANNRKNALTMLENGNLGIGNNVLTPGFILDIGGRTRIRHKDLSAGLFFDDSNNNPEGFVGMKSNTEIGFLNGNKWALWADNLGNAYISGSNYNTSDRRLKKDFSSLSSSLNKLSDLNGYNYFWKDSTLDQTLQTGLIAQEVETHFPELVKTDDKGFKSVNYTGLIPHLIESVKELKRENELIKAENRHVKEDLSRLHVLEDRVNTLMKTLSANSENKQSITMVK